MSSSEDADLLKDARRVISGDAHQGEGNAVYAVYVAVIAAGAYGVPASQQFFRFLDPQWMADHLGGVQGVVVGVVVAAALLLLAFRTGGIRGPVVPELPYLDHVATSPIDRAVVLRRWWRVGLSGAVSFGVIIGLVVGAGLAIAQVTGAIVLVPTVVVGGVLGVLVAGAWLQGQVSGSRHDDGFPTGATVFLRATRSLRSLQLSDLRAQAARSVTIGGGVLAGDLRAVRLDVAAPSTRARSTRLRARGPVSTLVARDVLGLRRAPGSLVTGLVLCAVAAYGLVHVTARGVPSIIALGAMLLAYLGVGQWAEGLRLQGDNTGTPPLIGLPARTEALAHLVVPGTLYVVVALVVGGVTVATGAGSLLGIGWAVVMVVLLLAAQLMAAFRGLPPTAVFAPGRGVGTTALWYAIPLLIPAIVGTAATAMLTSKTLASQSFIVVVAGSYGAFLWGLRKVRTLTEAHRG